MSLFPYSLLLQYAEYRFGGLLGRILPQKLMEIAETRDLALARGLVAPEREQRCRERRGGRVVLQELRHQPLAGEDVRHADVREVEHPAHQAPRDGRLAVGDDHRGLEKRRLERRGAARHEREVGRGERLVRMAEEERERQIGALVLVEGALD